jgi:uncharacterized membrane protein YqjE
MATKSNLLTKGQVLEQKVKDLNLLMAGVVIVLFIGFATMFVTVAALLISAFSDKQTSYDQLRDQVTTQNVQIQELTNQLKDSTVSPKQ